MSTELQNLAGLSVERWTERRQRTSAAHFVAVERTIVSMRRRFVEPLDLDCLCQVAAMSKSHFVRTFADVTGTTPHHFLACLRIEKAKELLLTTDADVTDICMTVGYASLGTFSSAFAALVGVYPSQYRRVACDGYGYNFLARAISFLETQRKRTGPRLTGSIHVPDSQQGFVFVGTFVRGVPLGVPEVGTIVLKPGEFEIPTPSASSFHLMAALLPYSICSIPRTIVLPVEYVASARIKGDGLKNERLPPLVLRKVLPTDPPLLTELSTLV